LLALGSRYVNVNSRLLPFANDAVMPFYILHQTIVVVLGYYVLSWTLGTSEKFLIIAAASFAASVALYAVAIRPWLAVRVLFGMRRATR
jgi:hypothetical protein